MTHNRTNRPPGLFSPALWDMLPFVCSFVTAWRLGGVRPGLWAAVLGSIAWHVGDEAEDSVQVERLTERPRESITSPIRRAGSLLHQPLKTRIQVPSLLQNGSLLNCLETSRECSQRSFSDLSSSKLNKKKQTSPSDLHFIYPWRKVGKFSIRRGYVRLRVGVWEGELGKLRTNEQAWGFLKFDFILFSLIRADQSQNTRATKLWEGKKTIPAPRSRQ